MEPSYLEFWYSALRSEHGVVIDCSDLNAVRQRLYAARREASDPALAVLSLVQSPTSPSELWIIKKEAAHGEEEKS